MSNISYLKGNILKKHSTPSILLHSCNCNGSWGGGIAYQLAVKYPQAEQEYMQLCEDHASGLLGKCNLLKSTNDDNLIIGCLFTASLGGSSQNEKSILTYTRDALKDLDRQLKNDTTLREYKLTMPKINSGIFGVPWEDTARVLEEFDTNFTVYVL